MVMCHFGFLIKQATISLSSFKRVQRQNFSHTKKEGNQIPEYNTIDLAIKLCTYVITKYRHFAVEVLKIIMT
jgi:hypothetical protein